MTLTSSHGPLASRSQVLIHMTCFFLVLFRSRHHPRFVWIYTVGPEKAGELVTWTNNYFGPLTLWRTSSGSCTNLTVIHERSSRKIDISWCPSLTSGVLSGVGASNGNMPFMCLEYCHGIWCCLCLSHLAIGIWGSAIWFIPDFRSMPWPIRTSRVPKLG